MGDSGPMDATVDIFENNISQGEYNEMFLFTLKMDKIFSSHNATIIRHSCRNP